MIGGSSPNREWEFFSSPPRTDRLWGQSSLLSNGYQWLFSWVKRPGRGADHSSLSSVEAKNAWSYTSTHNTPSSCADQLNRTVTALPVPYLKRLIHKKKLFHDVTLKGISLSLRKPNFKNSHHTESVLSQTKQIPVSMPRVSKEVWRNAAKYAENDILHAKRRVTELQRHGTNFCDGL
jgi:hypothetical protein